MDDQLTGLTSKQLFQERLGQILSQSQRYHFIFALMMLEIDNFRVFKNVLGLEACNELLKKVAERLQSCIRPMDVACRSEGSEFAFIISQLSKPETVSYVAKRFLETISRPFLINDQEIFLTASIGITIYPNDGDKPNLLIQNVSQALSQAKEEGNNTYQFYQKEMHILSQRELLLSSSLHNTDTFRQFIIYYQPWINTKLKKIVCMEAFLHWNHPKFGLIPEEDVLRLIEKSSNMPIIGEWLLQNTCQQLQKWRASGFDPGSIAVNISLRQLENPHFTYQISKILQETKLKPHNLIFQLSEAVLMSKMSLVSKSLYYLKQLGMQICVSHFGTGNISLQHLKGLPVHFLKIDKSLVNDLTNNFEAEAIVKMIIALAKVLKIEVVVGDVETDQHKQQLNELGCYLMEGNIICPPLAVSDFSPEVAKRITEEA